MPSPDQLRMLQTRIAPAAFAAARRTGVPAEFLCAQCILESGWLEHAPGNNCFGIKYYTGAPGKQLLKTREWFTDAQRDAFLARGDGRTAQLADPPRQDARGRKLYEVEDWFATFPVLSDCFTRRALMFAEGRYAEATRAYRETANLEAFVRAVAPVYATDPRYAEKILALACMKAVTDIVGQLWTATNEKDYEPNRQT